MNKTGLCDDLAVSIEFGCKKSYQKIGENLEIIIRNFASFDNKC